MRSVVFRNAHLSVSRLKLYEQCPRAFFFRYVSPGPTEPRGAAADFGTVLHAALEGVYRWVVAEEYEGPFPVEVLERTYREAWTESQLTGVALYQEGWTLLRAYVVSHATVRHWDILAVEKEFNIEIVAGGAWYVVNGFIDRVDRIADDWLTVVDYKSNRMLFYEDELANDLQMTIYGLVVREFWPWAKRVSFRFDMLRHDIPQGTERTAEQLDAAAGYVVALGRRTEDMAQAWEAKLNPNCSYCDSRRRCDAYAAAVAGKHEVAKVSDLSDFAEVCRAREELHVRAKAMYARKAELDDLIKVRLARDGEFQAGGYNYRAINQTRVSYPDVGALERAFASVGVDAATLRRRVLSVDKDAVEALRVEATGNVDAKSGVMLKATLQAIANREALSPKLDSHKVAKPKTASAEKRP